VCNAANNFANKNRRGHCIPGKFEIIKSFFIVVYVFYLVERCRVPLKQSYINASYADVIYLQTKHGLIVFYNIGVQAD